MNVFDDMPDILKCPHCHHEGDGLQWAFPDAPKNGVTVVQCACLACGAHGPAHPTYEEAIAGFAAGRLEEEAL